MNSISLFCSIIILVLIFVISVEYSVEIGDNDGKINDNKGSSVTIVTSENFGKFMSQQPILLEFYAPWCHHCTQFAPLYENIAEILERQKNPIKVGKVNVVDDKALAGRFGVKSIPSLYFYRDNKVYEYSGHLAVDEIVEWARNGHNKQKPMSMFDSPMSFVGLAKGWIISLGTIVYTIIPSISKHYSLSPFMSVAVVIGGMAASILLFTFTYVFLSVAHAKTD